MCGFAGFLSAAYRSSDDVTSILTTMTQTISRRGPDDSHVWTDNPSGIGMGFRRLAIVDLTLAGRQPMVSATDRYTIVFNGEIYNHLALRAELAKSGIVPLWKGHSDTETLLAAIEAWGLLETIKRCVGMFAIALWDSRTKELSLAVDRMGEKPLYYGWQKDGTDQTLLFGSELAALEAHPSFKAPIDRGSLCLLLRHSYIPAPHTIFQGIAKLEPGTIVTLSHEKPSVRPEAYWSLADVARDGLKNPFKGSVTEAKSKLEGLLTDALSGQMMADVPIGAFLSGGIDSSTIVALMQEQSSRPIQTFTIGFNDEAFDEAVFAKEVAAHLKTDHTELYVSPAQAIDVIPSMAQFYSEPFADSSQIPTYLVSKMARSKVTVSLSGDGGDELFCGYNRYSYSDLVFKRLSKIPRFARSIGGDILQSLTPETWDLVGHIVPGLGKIRNFGDKVHKGAQVLDSSTIDDVYMGLVSQNVSPELWVLGGAEPLTNLTRSDINLDGLNDIEKMMASDTISYLPGDILVKLDRATMAASLEGRVPFLDHRVVEFAWQLPFDYKLRGGVTKWILREILYQRVPKSLIERPKAGFGIPIDAWLRGPLRGWAESLLNEGRLTKEGYFQPKVVATAWQRHLSGAVNLGHQLWPVLMFQDWLSLRS